MHEISEMSVHSAKSLMELNQKREKEALRKEAAAYETTKLASAQIALLKEANDLAIKAHIEAQESKIESEKSSKRAFLSNIIAVASLLVAIASFVLAYVSSST